MHGEMKETIPAMTAKGMATSRAPDWTFWAKNSPMLMIPPARASAHGRSR